MANIKISRNRSKHAYVDSAPGTGGFATDEVGVKGKIFFSVRGEGSMTVTLQFKVPGDDFWSDYGTYTSVSRDVIETATEHEKWRAIVKDGDYTSGNLTFGFDW